MTHMRHRIRSFILALAPLMIVAVCRAEGEPHQSVVVHALELDRRGNMGAAIALLEPLVQPDNDSLSRRDRGIAWSVLARSYQDRGDFNKAQHGYEQATQILAPIPNAVSEYASTLDNFGSLYRDQGQFAVADRLRQRALVLYRQLSDHAGTALVLNNLAETAIQQKDQRHGREYLEQALDEMKHTSDIDPGDQAAIYSTKGTLFLLAGEPDLAGQAYQRSINLWQQEFGPSHYWVGWGYVLRAQCNLLSGDTARAEADVETGSAILEKTLGRNTLKYAEAQLVYARILKAMGDKGRAHMAESAARQTLQTLQRDACNGCGVSVEAFR
jgi:tetratricopeptide (TPR) repeat protein